MDLNYHHHQMAQGYVEGFMGEHVVVQDGHRLSMGRSRPGPVNFAGPGP